MLHTSLRLRTPTSLCFRYCANPSTASLRHILSSATRRPSAEDRNTVVRDSKMAGQRTRSKATEAETSAATATGTPPVSPADSKRNALALLDFINYAWTPYHAVEEASRKLLAAGWTQIQEKDQWQVVPGGRYFFTRNLTTIVAFAVGAKFQPGNGFWMVGAHTDSPCLKLKPVSKSTKSGCLMLNVELYGGGLWSTWFDRDLGLAGRVVVRSPGGGLTNALVKIDRPILRVPMLAIHLQRDVNTAGFKINLQTNTQPILATAVKAALSKPVAADAAAAAATPAGTAADAAAAQRAPAPSDTAAATGPSADASTSAPDSSASPSSAGAPVTASAPGGGDASARHHPQLLALLAKQLYVAVTDIVDFDLHVCDVQAGTLGGLEEEFVFVGRLDNLAMSFCALTALIETTSSEASLAEETGVRSVALFDHEEVGSDSAQGAGGPVMRDTITRVATALSGNEEGAVQRSLRASFLISADMAHALHPSYADKHDSDHAPKFHAGLVVKHNANQRYATDAVSAVLFREVGRAAGVPCQEFAVRNDTPCGSTIGPILASNLGCRTVDVGIPQLSMHSIREMAATDDVSLALRHFAAFFDGFAALDQRAHLETLPPPAPIGTIDDAPCAHTHG